MQGKAWSEATGIVLRLPSSPQAEQIRFSGLAFDITLPDYSPLHAIGVFAFLAHGEPGFSADSLQGLCRSRRHSAP
jgi:hypothetical protein